MPLVSTRFRPFREALNAAQSSPMLDDLDVDRPWLRFGSFVALTMVFSVLAILLLPISFRAIPDLAEAVAEVGVLSDTVDRLTREGYLALGLGVGLGALALAVLFAAALTYRRPPRDFLWPGRRLSLPQFGIGFAMAATVGILLIPYYFFTGSIWDPPILDPSYLPSTRAPYVALTLAGLLLAAAAEEIVCRGVLLRLTAKIGRRALLLCLLNGILFSTLHLDPDPVAFLARALSGIVWTWAAIRLGGLEFATGAHLANNLVISLFGSPLSESALSMPGEWHDLIPEVLVALVTIAVVERLARKLEVHSVQASAPG
jgi:membrane protease YdiL (CAAX protease family)